MIVLNYSRTLVINGSFDVKLLRVELGTFSYLVKIDKSLFVGNVRYFQVVFGLSIEKIIIIERILKIAKLMSVF